MRAVERRAPVIYQAAMFDGRFVGFADFLVARRRAVPAARHQAGPLGQGRGAAATRRLRRHARRARACRWHPRSNWCSATAPWPVTGSTNCSRYTGRDAPRCRRLLDEHLAGGRAGVVGGRATCGRASAARSAPMQVRAHDDLLLVAGMRVSQRARLIDAGITTVTELAGHAAPVPELSAAHRCIDLTAQARLQIATARRRQAALRDRRPAAADGAARARQRATCSSTSRAIRCGPSTAASGAWSTCSACSTAADDFHPLWAHDRAERAQGAASTSSQMVRKRRKRYPDMHIYHYAAYEKTRAAAAGRALRRRRGRGGRPAAQRRARRPVSVGAQEHSRRRRELQPQVARAALHGRRSCAAATSPRPPTPSPSTRATASCARRARRRGGRRAQGDRGVQPLRLHARPDGCGTG